jgi:hypothetical protein
MLFQCPAAEHGGMEPVIVRPSNWIVRFFQMIVAVMRKMITTLNAMVRDNAAWQPRAA